MFYLLIETEILSILRRYPQLTVYGIYLETAKISDPEYDVPAPEEFDVRAVMQNLALSGRITSEDSTSHVNSQWRLVA